jgi:lipopolysaccharide biosynthesis protein
MLWDVPVHWTLEDAATVPVVYAAVSWDQYLKMEKLLPRKHILSDFSFRLSNPFMNVKWL